jgi:hypothetical protein
MRRGDSGKSFEPTLRPAQEFTVFDTRVGIFGARAGTLCWVLKVMEQNCDAR